MSYCISHSLQSRVVAGQPNWDSEGKCIIIYSYLHNVGTIVSTRNHTGMRQKHKHAPSCTPIELQGTALLKNDIASQMTKYCKGEQISLTPKWSLMVKMKASGKTHIIQSCCFLFYAMKLNKLSGSWIRLVYIQSSTCKLWGRTLNRCHEWYFSFSIAVLVWN